MSDVPLELSNKKARTNLKCPNCKQEHLSRIARQGFFREKVFPLFGFYPWECAICRKQFLIRMRGGSYRRVHNRSSDSTEQVPSAEQHPSR